VGFFLQKPPAPRSIIHRVTAPVIVHRFNHAYITECMGRGDVPFVQRAGENQRMRSIHHLAVQNCVLRPGDCILRRIQGSVIICTVPAPNNKYRVGPGFHPPPMLPEDVPLPVQAPADPAAGTVAVTLCFGDRVLDHRTHRWLNPLSCITWPELYPGDAVLLVPQEGCRVLVNRQPTLVHPGASDGRVVGCARQQESMLGMRLRIGPYLSFSASCAPVEALRGDYDFVNSGLVLVTFFLALTNLRR